MIKTFSLPSSGSTGPFHDCKNSRAQQQHKEYSLPNFVFISMGEQIHTGGVLFFLGASSTGSIACFLVDLVGFPPAAADPPLAALAAFFISAFLRFSSF